MFSRRTLLAGGLSSVGAIYLNSASTGQALPIGATAGMLAKFAGSIGASVLADRMENWLKDQTSDSQQIVARFDDHAKGNGNYEDAFEASVYSTPRNLDSSALTYPLQSERSSANLVAPYYRYNCLCGTFTPVSPVYGPTVAGLYLASNELHEAGLGEHEFVRSSLSPREVFSVGYGDFDRSYGDYAGTPPVHHFKTERGHTLVRYTNQSNGTYGGSGRIEVAAVRDGSTLLNKTFDIKYSHVG